MSTARFVLTMVLCFGAIGFAMAGKYFAVIPAFIGFTIGGWPAIKPMLGIGK